MPDEPLTEREIDAWGPAPLPAPDADPRAPLAAAMAAEGLDGPRQLAGRAFAMACVALEITQRCNLDCTLCYLSDLSEAVHDLPMVEIRRRVGLIARHYGPGTTVQITGGDPTLRRPEELSEIVRWVKEEGLRAALFTNGIRATRALLTRLAESGLDDVAFHVDLTQERPGFATEMALNAVRDDYLARARGLGLRVIFNTTLFEGPEGGNLAEVPALSNWFGARAQEITMASFQMQAETGRGVLGARAGGLSQEAVMEAISRGVGVALDFDAMQAGHPRCNRAAGLAVAGPARAALHDRRVLARLMPALGRHDWNSGADTRRAILAACLRRPSLGLSVLGWGLRLARALAPGLLRGHRPARLSFMLHNFMDATALERDRCATCVFMTMTGAGPLSMCVMNARRDRHLLAPVPLADGRLWYPATGHAQPGPPDDLPTKRLKGRARAARMTQTE